MRKPIRIALEATALKPLYKMLRIGAINLQERIARRLQRLDVSSERLGPPKGVTTVDQLRAQGASCVEDLPGEACSLPVQRFVPATGRLQKNETIQNIPTHLQPSYILTLESARVYGENGLIVTKDDRIINEFAGSFTGNADAHHIFRSWKLPPVEKVSGRLATVGYNYAHGYYHWMLEILPRLEVLRRSGVPYDLIYMNYPGLRFQTETLKAAHFEFDKAFWATPKTHVKADQLVVPSFPAGLGQIPSWVPQYLRGILLTPQVEEKTRTRLLVSRRKAARRRILNEQELTSMLTRYGFTEVILEDLSVAEQAQLFAGAEIIIAAHGAALTNLVFCSPGAVVVELFAPTRTYNNYQVLTQVMGLKYHAILTSTAGLSRTSVRKQDMSIDCVALLRYLLESQVLNT